ncbi:conserved hypothetical protein [Ricinus communis]|uniref:DUF4283 domain-containing protein n=1 Tax=Ricinus communis TaxID=3988 RepID=B9SMJ0_RICCO|nr:conserved hypothetical protein [Ricinus communis]
MKHRVAGLWRPGNGMCVREIPDQLFLFQFFHPLDLKRIMEGGPWTFDNHMLILHHLQQGEISSNILLFYIAVWVQIHELPIGCMSKAVGRQLSNFIGTFMEYG